MYYPTYVKVQLPLRKLPCCSIRKVISEDDPDYEAFQYLRSAIAALARLRYQARRSLRWGLHYER